MEVLVAKGLIKKYFHPREETILNGVSLTVKRGETVAIMGPSGVGKSTLLHILGTLDLPTGGELEIAGKNALKEKVSSIRGEHIGFVFQNYNLLEEYTLIENIRMPSRIMGRPLSHDQARGLLTLVGLQDRSEHFAKQLSGGEKQRGAIARALSCDPDLILADEPSGNLDEAHSDQIHSLLIESAKSRKAGIVVVTHNLDLAKQCDWIYTLHDGKLEKAQ